MITNWVKMNDFLLAEQKTEVVLISSHKKIDNIKRRNCEHRVLSKKSVKYLRVTIDTRLNCTNHIATVAVKQLTTFLQSAV